MRATIKLIAEKAGVSVGTVDRVLHNRPYVKAEVRQHVLRVMEELDYQPNRMASALATSAIPRHLAVIQPEWKGFLRSEMAAGVARFQAERQDYNVSVEVREYLQGDMAACLSLVDEAVRGGTQAIALCASDCPEIGEKLTELAEQGVPVVAFNSDLSAGPRLCYVGENSIQAGRVAGEITAKFLRPDDHLMLVYAGPAYAGHRGRADGFLERLTELGFRRENCRIAATHENYQETYDAVRAALEADPSLAYIYMANQSVSGCVKAVQDYRGHGRVRVLAHDRSPEVCRFLREGWVDFTIDQDLAYQSYQALSVLFSCLAERRLPEQDAFCLPSPILNAELI